MRWRLGTAVLALVVSLLPYWIWNSAAGARGFSLLFRIPVAPDAVFDSYLYLQQISMLSAGVVTGSFGWFTWPMVGLMRVLPGASIPEIWVVSKWLMLVLLFWTGPWAIRRITGISIRMSRWVLVCFWLSFLVAIGFRPGVFSWYMPFGFVGFALLVAAEKILRSRPLAFVLVALVALAVLYVYPWFFLFGATVLATMLVMHFVPTHRAWLYGLLSVAAVAICGYAVLLVTGTLAFEVPVSFSFYERNGIGFAHVPLISNTILASGLWLVLLLMRLKTSSSHDVAGERLGWWWIVLLALWLSPPLVGLDVLNDHYILIAAMLGWMTLGIFSVTPEGRMDLATTPAWRRVAFGVAVFSSFFFAYILQKALWHIGKFDPYAIHLSIWLSLASAAWFHWMRLRGISSERVWQWARWALFAGTVVIGSLALSAVIRRNIPEMQGLRSRIPAIAWIRKNVPSGQTVCSDPASARVLAAHDGRVTFPSASNLMLAETDEVQHHRLKTVGAAYDTVAANDEKYWPFLINGVRAVACLQYARPAALLSRLGLPRETVHRLIGCHEDRARMFEEDVMTAIMARQVDPEEFRAFCPWVVVPDDRKAFWSLPGAYEEIRISGDTSIWHTR